MDTSDPKPEGSAPSMNTGISAQKMIELLATEVQLLSLGHVIPLNIVVDLPQLMSELEIYRDQWVDYLPRTDRVNDRKGLCLFGLPGDSLKDGLSLPEARARLGRHPSELEFNTPTELFHHCKSLHPLLNYFMPLGRTFFVKCNKGGWFHPHRDHPQLIRDSLRIVVFCKNSSRGQYDWILDNKPLEIEEGRAYYINTRLVHRTVSYVDESIHLILNIPVTPLNAQRIVKALQFGH